MWVTAHWSQFTNASGDWHHLANSTTKGGAGYLAQGGSYIGFVNVKTGDWTLIIEKTARDAGRSHAETATFQLDATLAAKSPTLYVWKSFIDNGRADNDTSQFFLQQTPVALNGGSSFSLDVEVGDVYTLTTLADAGHKGTVPSIPPPAPFPTQWADGFENCVIGQEADFFVSQCGSFLCQKSADGSGNVVMKQMAASAPIAWWPDTPGVYTETPPHSVLGSGQWRDTSVGIKFRLTSGTDSALLAVRCAVNNGLSGGGPIESEQWMSGVWARIDASGSWSVYQSFKNATNAYKPHESGKLNGPVGVGTWHTLQLALQGGALSLSVDGLSILSGAAAPYAPATGFVGIGTADFGQPVEFDDVSVSASY